MCSEMVTAVCFSVMDGVKVCMRDLGFQHQDCVFLYHHGQITAAWPSQCVIVSIMNGKTRVRLEFTVPNSHVKLAFELWVGAILA